MSARVALEEDRVKRAEDGDGAVLPAIREVLDGHAPEIWRDYGDLTCIVEDKWIARIWREQGLKVQRRHPKRGRLRLNDGSCVRGPAERPNHVRSYDFVFDLTHDGRPLRMLVLDQTLRHILSGFGPDDLRHMIRMPDYLAGDPHNFESYGELSFQTAAIYNHAVGWWDNDGATIFRPSPAEEAEPIVALVGGREKVLAEAQAAFDRSEFAWSAQLVNYLYKLDPQDGQVRLFKAKVLRQLAYLSTGANARSHLLTQALALEDKIVVPRLIPPQRAAIAAAPQTTVDQFRVRIDPEKSDTTDAVIRFEFTDAKQPVVGLHVRRAVAEYLPLPDDHYRSADVTIALSGDAWARLFLSDATIEELAGGGQLEMRRGSLEEAAALIALFDRYEPERAVLVAPHVHD